MGCCKGNGKCHDKKERSRERYEWSTRVPLLRKEIREPAQDQQDLRSSEVQEETLKTSQVLRASESSQQAKSARLDRFPVGLCLGRREGDRVILSTSDGEIVVGVREIDGDMVRLVFSAPRTVNIARHELLEKERA